MYKFQTVWRAFLLIILILVLMITALLFKPPTQYELSHGILDAQTNIEFMIYRGATIGLALISVYVIILGVITGRRRDAEVL